MSDPWEAATYDGLERVQRRAEAAASPEQRLAWLEGALRLALASGALERSRRDKQARLNAQWAATAPGRAGGRPA